MGDETCPGFAKCSAHRHQQSQFRYINLTLTYKILYEILVNVYIYIYIFFLVAAHFFGIYMTSMILVEGKVVCESFLNC